MKTKNIVVAAIGLLFVCVALRAQPGDAGAKPAGEKSEQEHFQKMKEEMLKDLDARLAAIQKARDCIGAAADHAAMKKCHEEDQAAMKAMMKAKKQERVKRIEERQKELDQEKQKLQQDDDKK